MNICFSNYLNQDHKKPTEILVEIEFIRTFEVANKELLRRDKDSSASNGLVEATNANKTVPLQPKELKFTVR